MVLSCLVLVFSHANESVFVFISCCLVSSVMLTNVLFVCLFVCFISYFCLSSFVREKFCVGVLWVSAV